MLKQAGKIAAPARCLVFALAGAGYLVWGLWMLPATFSDLRYLWRLSALPELCLPGFLFGLLLLLVVFVLRGKIPAAKPDARTRFLLAFAGLALTLTPVLSGIAAVLPQMVFVTGLALLLYAFPLRINRLAAWLSVQLTVASKVVRHAGLPVLVLVPTALVFFESNLGSYFLFDHLPHVEDSICQFFNSKILAAGKLTAPSPAPEEAFAYRYMIMSGGKWYSQYPPGHTLLLALGNLVGAPWLINPLFGALCVALIFFIGKELYGRTVGFMAAILASVCPFLVFMSSEFMNHVPTLFCIEMFLLCFIFMVKNRGCIWAALGGASLGYAFSMRPFSALGLGAPFLIYGIMRLLVVRGKKDRQVQSLVVLFSCGLAVLSLLALYNQLTNGSFFRFGYEVYDPNDRPGFGYGCFGAHHTPWAGLVNTLRSFNGLNYFLFGWPVPCLIFAAVATAKRRTDWDLLLICSILSNAFVYFFYWFEDWCFGPRYMFESTAALVLLTARGIALLPELVQDFVGPGRRRLTHAYTFLLLVICFAVSFTVYLPAACRLFGNSYWGVDTTLPRKLNQAGLKDALVFVRSNYGAFLPQMTPWLDSPIVYAKDRGPVKNKEVVERFPGRKVYIQTESGYGVTPYEP
ncbi:MAG TPA: glycosyltransferase family 39 protein [Candidatus Obscuribacterales bacterium]